MCALHEVEQSIERTIEVVADVVVANAENAVAEAAQMGSSPSVTCNFLAGAVCAAIDLDHDLPLSAKEVGEVGADGTLPHKLVAIEATVAQLGPQLCFSRD